MLTVYPARSVITMNPSNPRADAVLVRDDRVVEAGSLQSLKPWLDKYPHTVDRRFADAVITPGFIDPHLHPTMAAVLLPMKFITAMRWKLPWGTEEPVTTQEEFDARLQRLVAEQPAGEPLFTWGFHPFWHGSMSRERINRIASDLPVIVWHRSFHELYMNDAAMEMAGIRASDQRSGSQVNLQQGHFFENGLGLAINRLNPWIMAPERYAEGLEKFKQVAHAGGHTTVGDLATGIFHFDTEWSALSARLDTDDTPFRTRLVANALRMASGGRSHQDVTELAAALPERNTRRLSFDRQIKLFADGAFFSQLAQMREPGYLDGHHGEWMMPPETLEAAIRTYWHAGFQIHVHVTGDLGLELTLDILQKMQDEKPRFNHGFTIEHFGFSNPEQVRRLAALGGQVSANVYYLHELSAIYSNNGIGYERASQMSRLASCVQAGINTTLHSDFTMAPAEPLNSAWVAVNRINHEGEVMCPEERLTAEQALAAITINAARVLRMADETGSIEPGKKADFTVLAEDPLSVDPTHIRDIDILATVFEGTPYEVS